MLDSIYAVRFVSKARGHAQMGRPLTQAKFCCRECVGGCLGAGRSATSYREARFLLWASWDRWGYLPHSRSLCFAQPGLRDHREYLPVPNSGVLSVWWWGFGSDCVFARRGSASMNATTLVISLCVGVALLAIWTRSTALPRYVISGERHPMQVHEPPQNSVRSSISAPFTTSS